MIRLASFPKLDHLYRLTDSSGIRQRVRPSDPNAGYFVEQNAHALMVAVRALRLTRETGLLDYVRHYMAFLEQAQRPDGSFRAYMSPDGRWQEAAASDEAQGIAVWALGFAARHSLQTEVRLRALRCLDVALPRLGRLGGRDDGAMNGLGLRARAAALLGLRYWREAEPAAALDGVAEDLAASLAAAYQASSPAWPWFEPGLAPNSARLPRALLGTPFQAAGLDSLAWLCRLCEREDGIMSFALTAEDGRTVEYPASAAAVVSACLEACRASGDESFRRWAQRASEWFTGRNAAGISMVDPETGGCYDALRPDGVEPNQGAGALLAWLTAAEDLAES